MAVRGASAEWKGSLKEGAGKMRLGSGAFEGPYSFVSRFENGAGHQSRRTDRRGARRLLLDGAGRRTRPRRASTHEHQDHAKVHLGASDAGPTITQIDLDVEGVVPGIDAATFQQHAEGAKKGCVVSRALAGVQTITLNATLEVDAASMARIRLIHWNGPEGRERRLRLAALGHEAEFDDLDGPALGRALRASPPDAFVIDLSRLPSHGREVAMALRSHKDTRHMPIVFVDGDPAKVAKLKALLPDATYTTWGRLKTALPRAIARPATSPVVPPVVDLLRASPPSRSSA